MVIGKRDGRTRVTRAPDPHDDEPLQDLQGGVAGERRRAPAARSGCASVRRSTARRRCGSRRTSRGTSARARRTAGVRAAARVQEGRRARLPVRLRAVHEPHAEGAVAGRDDHERVQPRLPDLLRAQQERRRLSHAARGLRDGARAPAHRSRRRARHRQPDRRRADAAPAAVRDARDGEARPASTASRCAATASGSRRTRRSSSGSPSSTRASRCRSTRSIRTPTS